MILKPPGKAVAPGGSGSYISSFAVAPVESGMRSGFYGVGFRFKVSSARTIHQFGRFYAASNTENHNIHLWNDANSLLASGTILAASPSDAYGMKKITLSTPYALSPGTFYRISSQESASDIWKDTWSPSLEAGFIYTDYGYSDFLDVDGPLVNFGGSNTGLIYSSPAMFFTIP